MSVWEQLATDHFDPWTGKLFPGAQVIKLFSCSTQLSLKFQMLIITDIAQIN